MRTIALVILGALLAFTFASIETANMVLVGAKDAVVHYFDWLFVAVASGALLLVTALGVYPRANVKLGGPETVPEFSRFSWFAMLFSAGLASGLLYWATAEPVLHFQGNPLLAQSGIAPASEEAVRTALRITIFHWGFHGWGIYVLGAVAISIYAYRHDRPLTIRTALFPLLGPHWIDRWPGRFVDLLALLGTVFGVATSIGLSAAALNATLSSVIGVSVSLTSQIAIVALTCGLGVVSAISGLTRGIRRLSELNIWVSSFFLAGVFLFGPSLELFQLIIASTVDYLWTFIPLGLWLGSSAEEIEWQSAWTIFYWGWWLAWMPFVSLFIARISRGRSVREFVVAVMGVPTLMIIIWMTVLGGTALHQELADPGALTVAVNDDYSLGIVTMLDRLDVPVFPLALTAMAAFLLFTWLITSLDSATLVICHLVERPEVASQQVLWGVVLASVTSALIIMGGIVALQAASIVIGLPLAVVTFLIGVGLLKDMIKGNL